MTKKITRTTKKTMKGQTTTTIATTTTTGGTTGTKKRTLDPAIIAKGQAALAKWRAERKKAQKKGGKAWEEWQENDRLAKLQKKVTPMMAIKNFCLECVGGIRSDVS